MRGALEKHGWIGLLTLCGWVLVLCTLGAKARDGRPSPTAYGIPDEPAAVQVLLAEGVYARRDGWLRSSRYVLERLDAASLTGHQKTRPPFFADADCPQEFRASLADYLNSGFDRGHLACNADHEATAAEQRATFTLSNIAPQVPELNRGPWAKLEAQIRELAMRPATKAVWVATGPLILAGKDGTATIRFIGEHHIPVPTHFFKTILRERKAGGVDVWAIVAANELPTSKTFRCVSVDELEAMAGLDFWAGLKDEQEAELEQAVNEWPEEAKQGALAP